MNFQAGTDFGALVADEEGTATDFVSRILNHSFFNNLWLYSLSVNRISRKNTRKSRLNQDLLTKEKTNIKIFN